MKYQVKGAPRGFVVREPSPVLLAIAAPSPAALTEGDAGSRLFRFKVTRSGDLMVALSVTWTVTGAGGNPASSGDFLATTGTVSFSPGQVTANVDVLVKGDSADEPDEGFQVTLSAPTFGTIVAASATATIINDDDTGTTPPPDVGALDFSTAANSGLIALLLEEFAL